MISKLCETPGGETVTYERDGETFEIFIPFGAIFTYAEDVFDEQTIDWKIEISPMGIGKE